MKIIENVEILGYRRDLIAGMTDYMISCAISSESGAGYTHDDIDRCGHIVDGFLASLDNGRGAGTPEEILGIAKEAVIALNALNDACGGSLIETDQREQLCDIINGAANEAGLITDEDITEAWREW